MSSPTVGGWLRRAPAGRPRQSACGIGHLAAALHRSDRRALSLRDPSLLGNTPSPSPTRPVRRGSGDLRDGAGRRLDRCPDALLGNRDPSPARRSAKAIAVSEEALALGASVFVDRLQKLKALERAAEFPARAVAEAAQARHDESMVPPPRPGSPKHCCLLRLIQPKHCQLFHRDHEARPRIEAQLETLGRLRQGVGNPDRAALQLPIEATAQVEVAMPAPPR